MPIISQIGRKSWKVRSLIWTIYAVLIVGAVTMVYPFMLMVAGSTKTGVDMADNVVMPDFLYDRAALYRKHTEGLFNENLDKYRETYDQWVASFQNVEPPENIDRPLVDEWLGFLEKSQLPSYAYSISYISAPVSSGPLPINLRRFKRRMIERFDNDLGRLNREMGTVFVTWNSFFLITEDYLLRRNKPGATPFQLAFQDFKKTRPPEERYYWCVEGFYKNAYLKTQYGKTIEGYNASHGTEYASWDDVHLPRHLPEDATDMERKDWETFARSILNLLWLRAEDGATQAYRDFLKAKYRELENLNRRYEAHYPSFEEIPLMRQAPNQGLKASDWEAFLQGWRDPDSQRMYRLPPEAIRIHGVDFMFRDYLRERYGTVDRLNAALGKAYRDWQDAIPPQRDLHYQAFLGKTRALKWEFVKRNFITVVDYIVLHGRGVLNTVIYVTLAVLSALIVNPLAAYALSRYKPPSAYKILLFLMLTMAFPPMVTQIPVFLMLRQFNLLNTFWALILPTLANGYSIFLLKGFFDSLPQELYESAEIDGAGEFRIFWQITMSLSKPILAVIALHAFTLAYSNFMMALLICQDEKMWTLMPWLYQLQQRSGQGVIYASLIIAAIPTFMIFALCQNVIMRGIVVPVEK